MYDEAVLCGAIGDYISYQYVIYTTHACVYTSVGYHILKYNSLLVVAAVASSSTLPSYYCKNKTVRRINRLTQSNLLNFLRIHSFTLIAYINFASQTQFFIFLHLSFFQHIESRHSPFPAECQWGSVQSLHLPWRGNDARPQSACQSSGPPESSSPQFHSLKRSWGKEGSWGN